MTAVYEFVPGLGSHYSSRIRSIVLRNRSARKRERPAEEQIQSEMIRRWEETIKYNCDVTGQHRLDPFQTSAVVFSGPDGALTHHYLTATLAHLGGTSARGFLPPRDNDWRFIREHPSEIAAVLYFSAYSMQMLSDRTPKTLTLVQKHSASTMRHIRKRLENEAQAASDESIYTMIGLLATETHIIHATEPYDSTAHLHAATHVAGIRAALETRGGWNMGLYDPALQWQLIWQDIAVHGALSMGKTRVSCEGSDVAWQQHSQALGIDTDSLIDISYVSEFGTIYRNFYNLAMEHVRKPREVVNAILPNLLDLVQPGTPAFKILSSADSGEFIRSIVPILMLNIVVYNQRNLDPEDTIYEYWAMRKKFRACGIYGSTGATYLSWAVGMAPDFTRFADYHAMSLLARMLHVEHRLSVGTQRRLRMSCLAFLTVRSVGAQAEKSLWEPKEFIAQMRWEIMGSSLAAELSSSCTADSG